MPNHAQDNIQDDLENWVQFEVTSREVPEVENLPVQQPSYLSSCLTWVKNAVPSGQTVFFSAAESVTSLLGLKTANDGVRLAKAISKLYQGEDRARHTATLSSLLSQYAPGLVGQIANSLAHEGPRLLVKKLVVEKVVPYGFQTAFSSITNKVVDFALTEIGLDRQLENLFSVESIQQLIGKGITLSIVQGVDLAEYLMSPADITHPSVLDDTHKTFMDDRSNCYRDKALLEVQQAYIRAALIKNVADAVGAQVEALVKNHASTSAGAEVHMGLFLAAKAIRSAVEHAIKTQNGTAVSVDAQLRNAEAIMGEHFKKGIDLTSSLKAVYLSSAQQTACEKMKRVTSSWRSKLVDNDKPHLIKIREAHVEAYNHLSGLALDQMEIVEYVNGQRGFMSLEQTRVMQAQLTRINLDRENCLSKLARNVEILSQPTQNKGRLEEYRASWGAEVNILNAELTQGHALIVDSEPFNALGTSDRLKKAAEESARAVQAEREGEERAREGHLTWSWRQVKAGASTLLGYGVRPATPVARRG